jgi:cysteinyl-tRNA synthetase
LATHYRQSLNFTFDGLDAARAALARIDEFMDRLASTATHGEGLPMWAEVAKRQFADALNHDLNIAEALAAIFDMVHAGNRAMDGNDLAWDAAAVIDLVAQQDCVLGVLKGESAEVDAEVNELVEQRAAARSGKDWAASDQLRDQLRELGWEVRDTPDGQKLKRL